MSTNAHLHELRKKHQNLSQKVKAAQRTPGSDALELTEMKKRKLQLKEEIQRLSV